MRKWLTPLLLLTLLIAGAPARAYDFSYVTVENQTIYFRIVDSNAVVTYPTADDRQDWYEYTRPVGTVTIPQTVEHNGTTYTVTAIGHDAFFHCYQLTNVILPSTVTSIGERAFQRCAFRTLTLPSTVTYIGPRAFNSNDAMTEFTAEGVVTLDNGVFDYCLSLRTVNLGTHVTSIGHNAFRWCRDLTSITISDATTTIGDSAFVHCTSLRNVSFGTGVTSIGISAFRGCISLQSITLPTNLTAISDSLFARCTNL
ncbi:MAG: leucine-rich repeat domain-containing protein, partial [Bacteroidales bacterium]|nr:leucine-rich repeat domain-containing protein [Bacteroidales bacterium]